MGFSLQKNLPSYLNTRITLHDFLTVSVNFPEVVMMEDSQINGAGLVKKGDCVTLGRCVAVGL